MATSARCARTPRRLGCVFGAVNPNLFQDPDYRLGSVGNPDPRSGAGRSRTCSSASRSPRELGSTALSLWLADGTDYPGQDDLARRHDRRLRCLSELYAALPADQELLVEYKFFEPAFYATDIADWGSALTALPGGLGERARVLVDPGHHAQGANVEQIVALARHAIGSAASTSTTASTPTTT